MIKRFAQLMPGAMDVGLHRAERQVERRGDLFIASALHVAQENAGAVFGPEAGSFDPISSRADSSSLAMSNEVASTSAAVPACGEPLIEIVAIWRRRRGSMATLFAILNS